MTPILQQPTPPPSRQGDVNPVQYFVNEWDCIVLIMHYGCLSVSFPVSIGTVEGHLTIA
jgi:hypothetical protein